MRVGGLVEEGFDAAVRIGGLTDSSLVARRLASARIVTCASPGYLARQGTPLAPADLSGREFIIDLNPREPYVLDFGRGAHRQTVRVDGRLRFSGAQACLAAARAGFGIVRSPAFAAVADLRAGRLQPLLGEFEPEPVPIHVVYPQTRHLAAKVRAFIDFLAQRFAGEPEWHRGWK